MGPSVKETVRVILDCDGNVSQAARVLGISRQAIYGRLVRAGVRPHALMAWAERTGPGSEAKPEAAEAVDVDVNPEVDDNPDNPVNHATPVAESSGVNSTVEDPAPTFGAAMTPQATGQKPSHRMLAVDRTQYERLEEGSWDLSKVLHRTMTPAATLSLFFDEAFDSWLARHLKGGKDSP